MSTAELTPEQLEAATKDLAQTVRYPRVEKSRIDPPIAGPKILGLSIKPLPKPVDGILGFIKARFAVSNMAEFDDQAKYIIRTVDSQHHILPFDMGKWYPITVNEKFIGETLEVGDNDDLNNIFKNQETAEQKKAKEQVNDAKKRQRELLKQMENQEPDHDSLDYYAQQVMKKMQLEGWLDETRKRKRIMIKSLRSCTDTIKKLGEEHPDYLEQVDEKIREMKAGIGLDEGDSLTDITIKPTVAAGAGAGAGAGVGAE